MNIIIVSRDHGESKTVTFSSKIISILMGVLFVLPVAIAAGTYWFIEKSSNKMSLDHSAAKAWEQNLKEQQAQIEELRENTGREMDALTIRLAELQGRLMRVDAVGERLVAAANLSSDEFDFSSAPAVGGPLTPVNSSYQAPEISDAIDDLMDRILHRERQLAVLDDLIASSNLSDETFIAGRPIKKGWMSSRFGYRADPFTGRSAWHNGVDFAGKEGSDIVAVASGMVTSSGKRYGYGNMVEIDHGNGFKTRYAHCKELNVQLGDIVSKGDVIAFMGNTGRSTGSHVHFEVYKNGRGVDPAAYIHRRPR